MTCQTKYFDMFGVYYKTVEFNAVPGMELVDDLRDISPCELLARTYARGDDSEWLCLEEPANVELYVTDAIGMIAPLLVLRGLIGVVRDFNFGFLGTWKGVKVPSRFIDDVKSVSTSSISPLISQIIQSESASLRELEEYYSLKDAFKLFDIMMTKGVNAALSNEHANNQRRRK